MLFCILVPFSKQTIFTHLDLTWHEMMLKIAILEECFLHFPYLRNKLDKVASKTIVLFSHCNLPQNTYGEIIVTEESIVEDTKMIYETFLDENDETR